jgi:lipoprotein-anchoring transpeptidase ErfK/SrfK
VTPGSLIVSKTKTYAIRGTGIIAALILFATAAAGAWLIADDYMRRSELPAGVTIGGHDVSEMELTIAQEAVNEAVASPLLQPVEITFNSESYTLDPAESLTVDMDSMLAEAMTPKTDVTIAERAYRFVAQDPLDVEVETMLDVDGTPVSAWIDEVASEIDTEPVNAAFSLVDDEVVITSSTVGYETKREQAAEAITEALLEGSKTVTLPVKVLQPEVTEETLGRTIIVDLSERRLYLYDGVEVMEKYGVAIGTPRHPTPRGEWEIVQKRYMPTWRNPGSAWAADMPDYIAPGPSNPLGTRALNLDASGIRIHGTTSNWSIGRAASHGCMRMHRWDVEELYEEVEVGTKVFIVS